MNPRPDSSWISPSLAATADGGLPAYEHKFLATPETAEAVLRWAAERLIPDPHSNGGTYRITSVYFDTANRDVFYRSEGYTTHKYRVRRYGQEKVAHLERKSKSQGRIWKCRTSVPLPDLSTPATQWFNEETTALNLRPFCCISYERTAFVGTSDFGPIRLTADRGPTGQLSDSPLPGLTVEGPPLLPEQVVLEMKFLSAMPPVFKELVAQFQLDKTGFSKYRHCVKAMEIPKEKAVLGVPAPQAPAA
jgi:hypothetical protein